MTNLEGLLQQIDKELVFAGQTLGKVEADLHAIMQRLNDTERKVERSEDNRDVVKGLSEVAKLIDALGHVVIVDIGGRYNNVQRGFTEVLRQIERS